MEAGNARLEAGTQARITAEQIQVADQLAGKERVPGDIDAKTGAEHDVIDLSDGSIVENDSDTCSARSRSGDGSAEDHRHLVES